MIHIEKMDNRIYKGPLNYWHAHAYVPSERYYYGYYNTYGPGIDKRYYKKIKTIDLKENFGCGCSIYNWVYVLLFIVLVYSILV